MTAKARSVTIVILGTLAGLSAAGYCAPASAESVSVLLENGMYTEQTVGDLDAAIVVYKKILAHPQAKKPQRAQAQFLLGM